MILPADAGPLLAALAPHFTHPTYVRFMALAGAAILTTGRRTVANILRTVGGLVPGHRTSYQRVLSAAEWSGLELGCALARFLLDHVAPDGLVYLAGDDTIDGHPSPKVYGKGGTATRSGPPTHTRPGGTGIGGSFWPSSSGSR